MMKIGIFEEGCMKCESWKTCQIIRKMMMMGIDVIQCDKGKVEE